VLLLALALCSGAADLVDERRPTTLSFVAPAACPTRERFEQELVFRTNRVRLTTEPTDASAFIDVRITEAGRRFTGRLSVRTADGKNISKELRGPRCESVTAALSLAAALVLDPEGAKTGALPVALPPIAPEPAAVVVAPEPPPVVVAVEPKPPEAPRPPEVVAPPLEPAPRPDTLHAAVFALALLDTTVSGAIDLGGGAGAELVIVPASAPLRIVSRLGLGVTSGRTVTSAFGAAQYPVGLCGLLSAAAALQLGIVRPELGATLHVGSMSIAGLGADQNLTSQRWLVAVGPHARVSLTLEKWLLGVEAMLAISAIREQYRVDPDGLVFGVPPLGAVVQVQVGRTF
jgi:hypothetical protein